jgi:hypothetical protein
MLDRPRSGRGGGPADLVGAAVSYYAYAGQEQHANTTQTARAMSLLYALGFVRHQRRQRAVPVGSAGHDHRRGPAGGGATIAGIRRVQRDSRVSSQALARAVSHFPRLGTALHSISRFDLLPD